MTIPTALWKSESAKAGACIIGGVITGFFFMAATANSVAALPLGIVLIFGALLVYKWGTQEDGVAD